MSASQGMLIDIHKIYSDLGVAHIEDQGQCSEWCMGSVFLLGRYHLLCCSHSHAESITFKTEKGTYNWFYPAVFCQSIPLSEYFFLIDRCSKHTSALSCFVVVISVLKHSSCFASLDKAIKDILERSFEG
ncbi:hypothetical protein VNO77_12989 [Canavalia gladiata]|uniref:Uncharacterized protein n=1 Tax=Canavalia gladiata TaxID=3824 RepID=A0AAN9LXD4_CANGL